MSSLGMSGEDLLRFGREVKELGRGITQLGSEIVGAAVADGVELEKAGLWRVAHQVRQVRRMSGIAPDSAPRVLMDDRGVPYLVPDRAIHFMIFTDCADAEVQGRLAQFEEGLSAFGPILRNEKLPVFDKHGLGFLVASIVGQRSEIARDPKRAHTTNTPLVIIGNSAPREEEHQDAKGCPFVLAAIKLSEDPERLVFYVGTMGLELSYLQREGLLKDSQYHVISLSGSDTQFRSRYEPWQVIDWLNGDTGVVTDSMNASNVPDLGDEIRIGWIDNFGNIKLNLRAEDPNFTSRDLKIGERIVVQIGEAERMVKYGSSIADAARGELVLYRGSSFHNVTGAPNRFLEIAMVNGSAAAAFARDTGIQKNAPKNGNSVYFNP